MRRCPQCRAARTFPQVPFVVRRRISRPPPAGRGGRSAAAVAAPPPTQVWRRLRTQSETRGIQKQRGEAIYCFGTISASSASVNAHAVAGRAERRYQEPAVNASTTDDNPERTVN